MGVHPDDPNFLCYNYYIWTIWIILFLHFLHNQMDQLFDNWNVGFLSQTKMALPKSMHIKNINFYKHFSKSNGRHFVLRQKFKICQIVGPSDCEENAKGITQIG